MRLPRRLFAWLALNLALLLFAGGAVPLLSQQAKAGADAPVERQSELRRDARHLVELSLELHKAIEKSNENVLSLEILRKAEEVERLARELHERAKE